MSEPILVTGMPRSGTTWVAHMLAAGGGSTYVNEPLNPQHPPGGFPGVLDARAEHRFQYVCDDNEGSFLPAYRDLLRFRYHPIAELRRNHRARDVPHQVHHARSFLAGRLLGRRVLVADPYAVFSIPWFVRRLGFRVVVVVRRPAAAVASRKRLGWSFDPEELRRQPLLVRDVLDPLGVETCVAGGDDSLVESGALLWAAIHTAIAAYRDEPGDLAIVRHEDLSVDPLEGFERLYRRLGLEFTARAARTVARSSTASRVETPLGDPHALRLDSRANLENWKRRLTADEIERIDALTAAVARGFYPVAAASAVGMEGPG